MSSDSAPLTTATGTAPDPAPGTTPGEAPVLRLTGPILLGPEQEVGGAWVVGGRIHHQRPELRAGAEIRELDGFVVPGLADLHCHLGIGHDGKPTTIGTARRQALTDRDTGVLLIRDAGSMIDNSPLQQQSDLPRLIRCGRHLARTRRYLKGYADEVEPEDLPAAVTREAHRGDGWVKLVGDWIDRGVGTSPHAGTRRTSWPQLPPPTPPVPGSPPTPSMRPRCRLRSTQASTASSMPPG